MKILCAIILILMSQTARAGFQFYFGDKPRTLEVNGQEETLLVFPSPPFTKTCQPAGVLDLNTIASTAEAESLLPTSNRYEYINQIAGSGTGQPAKTSDGRDNLVGRLLKLTPLRNGSASVCAIKLVSGDTVMVRFSLQAQIQRPSIEFKNASSFELPGEMAASLDGLSVFRDLIQGGDLTYLLDVTPSSTSIATENASYTIVYVGSDSRSIAGWRIKGKVRKAFTPPRILKTDFIGQLLFSSWQPRKSFKEGDEFQFYLLSTHDFSRDELASRLP